ncbi:DUF3883 domain-containing protein [Kitasatospora sp. NPDC097605]|uniref:DUF3883 domain-containing protein n=1 Tax=Kitasatospora sp. NPDC097605 TaxID=3157226 RepID=UPI0033285AE4
MTRLPAEGAMRAALRWLHVLRTTDVDHARALFTHHDAYADLTPAQYADGLEWLERIRLIPAPRPHGGSSSLENRFLSLQLLERSLEAVYPGQADELSQDSGGPLRPSAPGPTAPAEALARTLGLTRGDADAALAKAGLAERARVGAAGEAALVALLRRTLRGDVVHVSEFSDRAGYDIAVEVPGGSVHLEVKSTTNRAGRTLFLSRHEYETMRTDPAWHLVFLVLDEQDQLGSVSTVSRSWIESVVPVDRHPGGAEWASAQLSLPSSALTPGITAVHGCLRRDAPASQLGAPQPALSTHAQPG